MGHPGEVDEVPVARHDDLTSLVGVPCRTGATSPAGGSGVGAAPVGDDHGLVHQIGQHIDHVVILDADIRADRFDGGRSKPPANTARRSTAMLVRR